MQRDHHETAGPPRRIRLLFVIGTLEIGGAETQLVELIRRLDRTRFDPALCCLGDDGPLAPLVVASGARLYALGFRGFKQRSYIASFPHVVRTLWRFWRTIRKESPEILHAMLFWAYVLSAFIGRAARVPVIVASRRSLGLFKAQKRHFLFVERIANRLTDLVIANSAAVRADTIEYEHIDPKRVLVVHNGVDFERFPAARPMSFVLPEEPRILVVANLIAYKGHRYFLDAWPGVVRRFPHARAQFAGHGPMLQELRDQANRLGVASSVEFLGRRSDVPALLAQCDLYVHPSLEEGYSNAILEAMAAGAPIVATSVGGTVEAIVDGETGVLVPAADAGALERAMVRMLEDRDAAGRMARSAASVARSRYDTDRVVRRYEDIYAQLATGTVPEFEPAAEGMSRCAV
ncbi:MAG TPA: glycosyltransferase [Vicinamibacterales bacterium]|nr:glycosyltransferase [Vicinamibacterales bacterium]